VELLGTIFWTAAVCAYFFQFPFSFLSSLITPCLALYFLTQLPNLYVPKNKCFVIGAIAYFAFIAFCAVRSLILGIPFSRIFRFAVILIEVPLFCFIKDPQFTHKRQIFLICAVLKSVMLILITVMMLCWGDYSPFRIWARVNQFGDIYILNGVPKVQVHGNALLIMAFFTDFLQSKRLNLCNIVVLIGVLLAGNFAFFLALGLFVLWLGRNWAVKIIKNNRYGKHIIAAILLIAVIITVPYLIGKLNEKSEFSNATRIDQAAVLLDANPVIGDGLGYIVRAVTPTRVYDGDIYFELQSLYIYKQIGLIGIGLFYFITVYAVAHRGKNRLVLYLIYLAYTFWNPYCFDVTQIIAIILILNTAKLGAGHEKSAYYRLLPIRWREG